MTPEEIAASLGKRERKLLQRMDYSSGLYTKAETVITKLAILRLCTPEFSAIGYKGDRINALGRVVAAAIRERGL